MLHVLEFMMVTSVFDSGEKMFLKVALTSYRSILQRSLNKETNAEIIKIRNEDIRRVNGLIDKIGVM